MLALSVKLGCLLFCVHLWTMLLNVNCYWIICCLGPCDNNKPTYFSETLCDGECMQRLFFFFHSLFVCKPSILTFLLNQRKTEKLWWGGVREWKKDTKSERNKEWKKNHIKRDIKEDRQSFRRLYNRCSICCASWLQGGWIWMLHKSLAWALISHIAHPATPLMFHYCSLLGEILKAEHQKLKVNPNHCKIMIWCWGGQGCNFDKTRLLTDASSYLRKLENSFIGLKNGTEIDVVCLTPYIRIYALFPVIFHQCSGSINI